MERARAARAGHVCVLVRWGREVFVSCAFGEMCDVGIFLGERIVQRAFVVCLLERARAARARHVCVLVGWGRNVFVLRAFGEMCDVRIFFWDALFSARLSFVYWSVRAQHVRGTCASWWDVGMEVFVLRAFGEMCDVRIFFGGTHCSARVYRCLLERARAACAGVYCFRGGSDVF